jgi:hypothetical protein
VVDTDKVLRLSTKTTTEFFEREPLFEIDGVAYTIPVKFPATTVLAYNDVLLDGGASMAEAWLLKHALRENGFRALLSYPMTTEQLAQLVDILWNKLIEAAPVPKGNTSTE